MPSAVQPGSSAMCYTRTCVGHATAITPHFGVMSPKTVLSQHYE